MEHSERRVAHHDIYHFGGVYDLHPVAYLPAPWPCALYVTLDEGAQRRLEIPVAGMAHHECSQLRTEPTENDGIARARLVEHGNRVALSEGGIGRAAQPADI